jgi:gliding motility-associated-like protein
MKNFRTHFSCIHNNFIAFLFAVICFVFLAGNKSIAQSKIWEDSFNGGVTSGGYSPEYQSGGEGTFTIKIEKGSTIRKAFLMAGRFGNANPLTVTMNGKNYVFDHNNKATKEYQSRTYGGSSCVHVLEVTSDIDPNDSVYTLNIPQQGGPLNRYNDFYLFIAYENVKLKKISAAIFLRATDISPHDKFNINLNVATHKTSDIAISLYCGYICNKVGDGENVFLNGDKLGQLKGNDSNSQYCGGPMGSFYYKDNKMFALEDDNVDKKVDGSDALINAKSLLKDKCKAFVMDFEVDQSVYGPHETNSIWGVIIAYGTEDCKVKDASVSDDQQVCKGSSVSLTASGGEKYVWSNGARTATIEVKPEVSTKYFVTISGGGCSEKDTVEVDLFNSGSVDAGKDTTISVGSDVVLKASGGSAYKWSSGDNSQTIIVTPQRSTTYTVTVSSGECSATDKVTVNVSKVIKANAGKDTTICAGTDILLKATGGDKYLWSTGDKTQMIKVKPTVSTTYLVTVSYDNNTSTDDVLVNVVDLSKADAGNDTTICAGSPIILKASGGLGYRWSNGEKTQSLIIRPKNTISYLVTVTTGNCSTTDKVTITVNNLPAIDAGKDIVVLSDSSAVIKLKGPEGNYKWHPESGLSCIDCKNPTVAPDSTTTYTVTYIADNGCKAIDTITVHSKEHHAYYVTNPFTPNNDGENDLFMISLRRGKLLNYTIFDKLDRMVFRSSVDNYSWEGKYKGENMPTGVYIYHLNYIDEKGKTVEKTGTFYLIR